LESEDFLLSRPPPQRPPATPPVHSCWASVTNAFRSFRECLGGPFFLGSAYLFCVSFVFFARRITLPVLFYPPSFFQLASCYCLQTPSGLTPFFIAVQFLFSRPAATALGFPPFFRPPFYQPVRPPQGTLVYPFFPYRVSPCRSFHFPPMSSILGQLPPPGFFVHGFRHFFLLFSALIPAAPSTLLWLASLFGTCSLLSVPLFFFDAFESTWVSSSLRSARFFIRPPLLRSLPNSTLIPPGKLKLFNRIPLPSPDLWV